MIRTNVAGTLTSADICKDHGLFMMDFATGCIFEYEAAHPQNTLGKTWLAGLSAALELLKGYDNVCTLRLRMSISSDLNTPQNFIAKISRYSKVVNIPNSTSVLDELLPTSIGMAKRNLKGTWKFTNPVAMSHNEIVEMYMNFINPNL
ncbi:hypothetical protein Nepgr_027437 [Nepenthes gracilis]|uniref:Uncharacterized protein n=1 Tax=Nepenthes gracilis TaxID=150966 RepID=A0AAD3TAT2_NEPGR|nr:hypothetical protein Nepgr_027437 [Nepenthes gracilis]